MEFPFLTNLFLMFVWWKIFGFSWNDFYVSGFEFFAGALNYEFLPKDGKLFGKSWEISWEEIEEKPRNIQRKSAVENWGKFRKTQEVLMGNSGKPQKKTRILRKFLSENWGKLRKSRRKFEKKAKNSEKNTWKIDKKFKFSNPLNFFPSFPLLPYQLNKTFLKKFRISDDKTH